MYPIDLRFTELTQACSTSCHSLTVSMSVSQSFLALWRTSIFPVNNTVTRL